MTEEPTSQNAGERVARLQAIRIEDYAYDLPDDRIAKFPLAERDSSKLLTYGDGEIRERRFCDVPAILDTRHLLVFNDTKVIHARLLFRKSTGALIEVFCLEPAAPADYAQNFASVGRCRWKCMVGNFRKWKEGVVRCAYVDGGVSFELVAERVAQEGNDVLVEFSWDSGQSFS